MIFLETRALAKEIGHFRQTLSYRNADVSGGQFKDGFSINLLKDNSQIV